MLVQPSLVVSRMVRGDRVAVFENHVKSPFDIDRDSPEALPQAVEMKDQVMEQIVERRAANSDLNFAVRPEALHPYQIRSL